MSASFLPRYAHSDDHDELSRLMNFSFYLHRHLDWRHPLDLLGEQPFWLLEDQSHRITAALACPPFPPDTAWVNFFLVGQGLQPDYAWEVLFDQVINHWLPAGNKTLAALPSQPWFTHLISTHGFEQHQNVIILEWNNGIIDKPRLDKNHILRIMKPDDLEAVQALDNTSFEPLWQLSPEGLKCAYHEASYATVIEEGSLITGYQITTLSFNSAHLARLAIATTHRQRGMGTWLVQDLLSHFKNQGVDTVTVNTQEDNLTSQSLYLACGFRPTGEKYPVYLYNPA